MYYTIKEIINSAIGVSSILETPRDKSFGHFALPTFSFAKELHKAPQILAQEFAQKLESLPQITSVNVVNGYVNFSLSSAFLGQCAWEFLQDKTKSKNMESQKERILLEYVSANPTGPLHIGHARGAIFGDSLARIGRFLGYAIHTEYYINDAGAQIEKLGKSIYYAGRALVFGESRELPADCYQGEYVFELAQEAKNTLGDYVFENLESLEKLCIFGKDKMLEEIKSNLAQVGIVFDSYVSEKELFTQWDSTLKSLKAHNGVYANEEKLWLKSTEYGDEKDRVIVRESGEPTYLAGDIIYHKNKFERNFSHYINIWGADHHGYIARVKAALEYLGFDSQKLEILLAQMVALLKDGIPYKMSKRAGNFILMKDVVEDVGADALRLMFLSKKPDTHLEFDVNLLKKQDASNPVYYINYAHARIYTLFSKSSFTMESFKKLPLEQYNTWNLQGDLCDLLVSALGIKKVLNDAFSQRLVNKVVDYLYALAADFHRFYNETKILNTENEEQILKVLVVVAHSIALGLDLLGVRAKESM
ncbi:arginine--tRNA ligase [Helicobacter turcicus]|uniref:Arginine--tRNA ligase n=1 Tax=Helicobacter turcicus TaxID=2867412 RepID=A0ABS7JP96_9HELI|nr:arginine--tRNA ligase [Helicobacter turcicus]MBX7491198.1 arginine--tRNA ligase [Helicobacter turcicus]MBX7546065.1 arginine--tRNA ligase [Helicobacter turcicus]